MGTTVPGSWDIFCRVVDNFGDIGVCWRLARQLAGEQGGTVRLWVDDLAPLHALCRAVDPGAPRQRVEKVEVHYWTQSFPAVLQPAEVVIEAFGCGLPEDYVRAMVACRQPPLWVVLEYLSAEAWVPEHHGLPSPHARWPLPRYFFFPGFAAGTGGLLCEADLEVRRNAFGEGERHRLWEALGFEPPAAGSTVVSMFAYANAPVKALLSEWEQGDRPVVVAVPEGPLVAPVLDYFGAGSGKAGHRHQRGSVEVRIVPFVEQTRYDELLWSCDCNFVRGEDSFVRAQWAAQPLVWHIYPQAEGVHRHKLEAFLDRYCAGLQQPVATAVRRLWRAWNSEDDPAVPVGATWRALWGQRAVLMEHARAWAAQLGERGDLAARLAQFCAERVKY